MAVRQTLRQEVEEAKAKALAFFATAEKENRELTEEERGKVEAHLAEARDAKARIDRAEGDDQMRQQLEALGATKPETRQAATAQSAGRAEVKSLGQQFVESAAMDYIRAGKHRGAVAWSTPVVELATTLTEDSGSGGPLILPQYRPGILPLLFKRLYMRDLIAPGNTISNSVGYMQEKTFTNAAASRSETAALAESALVFEAVTDPVRSIGHWIPVTEEMLEDVAQIQSYVDQRLIVGLKDVEETQLLSGDGTAPNISGILDRTGLHAAQARGSDTNPDAVFKQITALLVDSLMMPDGIVMHPSNWQTIVLGKDAQGQYYGNGPFSSVVTPTLWGLPVAVSPAITANTALVGAFRGASQIFDRRGISVQASNSHSDYFTKKLVAIRAEERLALAVYRPGAFGTVTGLA